MKKFRSKSGSVAIVLLAVLFCIVFGVWGTIRTVKSIVFNIECNGHLKRAADASTIELAKQELTTAITYLEKKEITTGYTSVLYKTPDEDIGFWYKNLKESFAELEKVKPETTQLEKTNLLMKLRETLLDEKASKSGGVEVTSPDGISIFPNNVAYCFFGWVSSFIAPLIAVIIAFVGTLRY